MKKVFSNIIILVLISHPVFCQNYLADFMNFKSKADSLIMSLSSRYFVESNYYLSVEESHPYLGQGSFGTHWTDTTWFKNNKTFPEAYDYVYMIKNINEVGLRVTVEREPGSLKKVGPSYNYLCFVNGLPGDTSTKPRNFLSVQQIRSTLNNKKDTSFTIREIELKWETTGKAPYCFGSYYYKASYYTTENRKKYLTTLFINPATGVPSKSDKKEFEEDENKIFNRVTQ